MQSFWGESRNFTEPKVIAAELTKDIPAITGKNSIAFLSCDSQVDSAALLTILSELLECPIVGASTFGFPTSKMVNQVGALLILLSGDDVHFSIAVSQQLTQENAFAQIKDVYSRCTADLDFPPKLIMPFIPFSPHILFDIFTDQLLALAGSIPVFGGIATGDLESIPAMVYADGSVFTDRMVLVSMGGNIRPVFSVGMQITKMSDYAPEITHSIQNTVYKVDDLTFCDYLHSIGIQPKEHIPGLEALMQYGPLACELKKNCADLSRHPDVRVIRHTNLEEKSAVFTGHIPVGSRINTGMVQKDDVVNSMNACLEKLKHRINAEENQGYNFSAVFCISCVARYFSMLGADTSEKKMITENLPEHLAPYIAYGFGEIAPSSSVKGNVQNHMHYTSIIMCAI